MIINDSKYPLDFSNNKNKIQVILIEKHLKTS